MDRTTAKLVGLATTLRGQHLHERARRAAKARVLSALAASLAAYDLEPVRIVRSLAHPPASGPAATVFGSCAKATPEAATFVNSAMVRALDMSDSFVLSGVSHPADAFPAVLAVAEAEHRSGEDLLVALAIAYEAQCRFAEVVPLSERGWDQTPVVAVGAALGASRLLGATAEQTAHAIALAVAPNIALNQTRTGTLSMWKGLAGPQGARAGVCAAYLARSGITGPDDVFEGRFGLWNQTMRGEAFDLALASEFQNHTFAVQQTTIKLFPTRLNCQVPVLAAQKLRSLIDVERIKTLEIASIRQAFARWMDVPEVWRPQTRETADHSLPCTVAMALLDGTITPRAMQAERYKDEDVHALMAKCTIALPDDFAALAPRIRCCRLTATLESGERVVVECRRSTEDDVTDSGWDASVSKLHLLTADRLDPTTRAKLIDSVGELERCNPRELVELTRL